MLIMTEFVKQTVWRKDTLSAPWQKTTAQSFTGANKLGDNEMFKNYITLTWDQKRRNHEQLHLSTRTSVIRDTQAI